jgi:hypothetical protein
LAIDAAGTELPDELAEGRVVVAEAFGHILLAAAVDEDGAQGLVLTLRGAGGFLEEAAAGCVVHNRRSLV